jgi:hypothetical protein
MPTTVLPKYVPLEGIHTAARAVLIEIKGEAGISGSTTNVARLDWKLNGTSGKQSTAGEPCVIAAADEGVATTSKRQGRRKTTTVSWVQHALDRRHIVGRGRIGDFPMDPCDHYAGLNAATF